LLQGIGPVLDDVKSHLVQVQRLADGVLQQTGVAGQQEIRQQIITARERITDNVRRTSQLARELHTCLAIWNDVDMTCEQLMKWLKITESQLHNFELKSTLDEKHDQLDQLLVITAINISCIILELVIPSLTNLRILYFSNNHE